MKKQSIYLAGPITGKDFNGANDWRKEFQDYFWDEHKIVCYSPLRGKHYLSKEKMLKDHYEGHLLSNLKAITIRDHDDVKNAGLVVCNFLDAEIPSLGTCIEIGWANAYRVPTIVIMDESNIHWHGMIREMCLIVDNVKDAMYLSAQILDASGVSSINSTEIDLKNGV